MFIDEANSSNFSIQTSSTSTTLKDAPHCYIAMECVDGKDKAPKLAERRKYLPESAVFIAHEMLSGLDYAHKKTTLQGEALNIVHRDMSPSNVLVGYEGDVKVADFGIAKAEHRAYDTKDGVLKGKFEYMSPEQARGKKVTGLSDVFSSGIILWEMLTGRRMFKTESDLETLEKIKAGGYPPPSVLNPHIGTASIASSCVPCRPIKRALSQRTRVSKCAGKLLGPQHPGGGKEAHLRSCPERTEKEALESGAVLRSCSTAQIPLSPSGKRNSTQPAPL